jgi:arabinofuranan 3-O-arabinosyltransferase
MIGLLAVTALVFVAGGPVALAVPVLAVIGAWRSRLLPGMAAAAMLGAGTAAATAAHPTVMGSGAFGPVAQACALVALAAALLPEVKLPIAKPPASKLPFAKLPVPKFPAARLPGGTRPPGARLQELNPSNVARQERMLP